MFWMKREEFGLEDRILFLDSNCFLVKSNWFLVWINSCLFNSSSFKTLDSYPNSFSNFFVCNCLLIKSCLASWICICFNRLSCSRFFISKVCFLIGREESSLVLESNSLTLESSCCLVESSWFLVWVSCWFFEVISWFLAWMIWSFCWSWVWMGASF